MDDNTKNSFAFILGREQEIALSELKSVLGRFGICFPARNATHSVAGGDIYKITGNVVFANIDNFTEDDAARVMDALAGTVKIFEIIASTDKDIASQIARIFENKKTDVSGKINFGISYYGKGFSRQNINSIALTAKKKLKDKFSLRYVESRDSFELSTILTLKNNLSTKGIEFGLFENTIGVLVAFNNPEEWNKRDYDKPACDKYSGMVPPKLARMMVNLALECHPELVSGSHDDRMLKQVQHDNCLVLDPFCGSGNILLEAMMLGHDVVGSDNSEKAVNDSQANIEWLLAEYHLSGITNRIFQADATSYDFKKLDIGDRKLVIVAEPYLGEPKKFKPTYKAAIGEYAKIKELYIKFLKNIYQLQTTNYQLTICIVFPLVETLDGRKFSLFRDSVDEIKKLGYTQVRPSMIYGREYQIVKREIVLLHMKQKDTSYKKQ